MSDKPASAPTGSSICSDDRSIDDHVNDFVRDARKDGSIHHRMVADALFDRQTRANYWEKEAKKARESVQRCNDSLVEAAKKFKTELVTLAAERDAARAARDALQDERDTLRAERDVLIAERDAAQAALAAAQPVIWEDGAPDEGPSG